jgi:hypothetical protein
MTIEIIPTSQAPDAKPVAKNLTLTVDWQNLVSVPKYEVPELVFGGDTVNVLGVGEIISPLIIANRTITTERVSVRVFREEANNYFFLANELAIPAYDVLAFPLNGQFFYPGDTLEVRCSANNAFDVTLSYTIGQAEEDDVA